MSSGQIILTVWRQVLVASLALLCAACFNVREPAAPQSSGGDWTPPTEPDILMQNFSRAVATVNITNYERCFNGPNYSFVPDPTVAVSSQAIFSRWTIVEEVEYLKNVSLATNGSARNTLQFLSPQKQFITVDSLEYQSNYELMLYTADENFATNRIRGRAIFFLKRKPNTEWVISRWQDSRTGTEPCFSDVKRHFIAP